jgi:hypothetical protein
MINYSALRHVVILAQPKPKPIEIKVKPEPVEKRGFTDYSNCRKAMIDYARGKGRGRDEFRIKRLPTGRYRFVPVASAASSSSP